MTSDLPLHVVTRGAGPPVVFIHGFGARSFTWRHWVEELEKSWQTVLVDLKGFGDAPKPADGGYGPLDQADLVARLVVERDLSDVTLVGHSMGGGIAFLAALLLQDRGEGHRLVRLVSVAGMAYPQPFPFYIAIARKRHLARLLLFVLPTRGLIRGVLKSIVHDPSTVTDEQVGAYSEALFDRRGRHALVESALRIVPPDADDWIARFPEIDVPTLLLWGRSDAVVPLWVGQRLARDLPRARLEVVPRCGHIPPEERPLETLEILRDFLSGPTV